MDAQARMIADSITQRNELNVKKRWKRKNTRTQRFSAAVSQLVMVQ